MNCECSLFVFRFQIKGSVFHLSTEINDDSNLISCSKRAFSDFLEGVALKIFLGTSPQTPIFHPLLFYATSVFCNVIVEFHLSEAIGANNFP